MERDAMMRVLEYISDSPPQENGGFHPQTVEAAKAALAEIAALRARAEKAEAEAAEWKAASAINGSNMAGYQTRSIVAEERLVKAEARAERLADYVVADLALTAATLGDGSNREVAEKNQLRIEALAAIRVHRDLEGGAA